MKNKKTKQKTKDKKWYKKFIPITKSEKILCSIFVLLLILVIILSIIAVNKTNKIKKEGIYNTVSIIEQNSNYLLNIDISNMKPSTTKEYKFKVTNYNKKVLSKDLSYTISLNVSDNPVNVKVYKNDKLIDLDNVEMKLKKDIKQDDVYKVVVESTDKTNSSSSIILTILSK